jgi:hypothetical protein
LRLPSTASTCAPTLRRRAHRPRSAPRRQPVRRRRARQGLISEHRLRISR